MLKLDKVKSLPLYVSIVYKNSRNKCFNHALITKIGKDSIWLVTENGAFSNPLFKNYGKTWWIEKASKF